MEVADILHAQGDTFVEQHPWLSVQQRSVLRAIARCRTAALGGHLDRCDACGHQAISYNSCRNRHCPKCQAQARERWLHARERELLDVPYVHVVFTLPHALLPLAYRNSTRLYTWLFQASAATLREVAADPRHLGAEIGVLSILHTWGQTLVRHPHVHCVVPAGGLSPDHQRWIRPKYAGFFLPVKILSRVFRGKFVAALRRAYARDQLDLSGATEHLRDPAQWHAFVDALFATDWVVYAKPAFGGASAVLRYLGRYTHRVAISNHRLLAFDGDHVTFQWKDYAHGDQRRTMTLSAMEFLRRFVQHILPRGFVRIRQSGFLANTCRATRVALARTLLAAPSIAHPSTDATAPATNDRDRRDVGLPTVRGSDDRRPDPLGAPPGLGHARLRHLMSASALSSRPASSSTWSPTCQEWCASIPCASPSHRGVVSAARHQSGRVPPPLARRRPLDRHRATRDDPTSSSIAGRRASGFLQVSLSKVPRHPHRAACPASRAESLPMNANDYSFFERSRARPNHVRFERRCCVQSSAAYARTASSRICGHQALPLLPVFPSWRYQYIPLELIRPSSGGGQISVVRGLISLSLYKRRSVRNAGQIQRVGLDRRAISCATD